MSMMIVFAAYPKAMGSTAPPNAETDLVHLRLDKILSVDPIHGQDVCQVHMSNGYVHRVALKAEEFVKHFLTVLGQAQAQGAEAADSHIIVPPRGGTPVAG